jgi:chromate reductase
MKIVGILGTAREGNYTGKAFDLVMDELESQDRVEVDSFRPEHMILPWPGTTHAFDDVMRMQKSISSSDGVILATPEYHGSFSSTLKFLIENMGFPSALAGKPVALLGVASGQIGAIKSLEQLRGVCSHVGALVLPGGVSVAQVNRVFDQDGNCLDEKMEDRIRGVARHMVDFIERTVCPAIALERMVREPGAR